MPFLSGYWPRSLTVAALLIAALLVAALLRAGRAPFSSFLGSVARDDGCVEPYGSSSFTSASAW
jgi:hypothetical protein